MCSAIQNVFDSSNALSANSSARLLDGSREEVIGNSSRCTLDQVTSAHHDSHFVTAPSTDKLAVVQQTYVTREYDVKETDHKFASEDAWWDSRGLQPGTDTLPSLVLIPL